MPTNCSVQTKSSLNFRCENIKSEHFCRPYILLRQGCDYQQRKFELSVPHSSIKPIAPCICSKWKRRWKLRCLTSLTNNFAFDNSQGFSNSSTIIVTAMISPYSSNSYQWYRNERWVTTFLFYCGSTSIHLKLKFVIYICIIIFCTFYY